MRLPRGGENNCVEFLYRVEEGASLVADDVALVVQCDLHRSTLRRSLGKEGRKAYYVMRFYPLQFHDLYYE